jgi:hypothetical protein
MPFEAYLPHGFVHSHENRMFHELATTLAKAFGSGATPVYLLGNVCFSDKELDSRDCCPCRQSIHKRPKIVKRNVLPHKTIDFICELFGYGKDIIPHLAVTTTGDVRGKMKERMLFSVEGCASTEKFIVCLRDRSSVRSLFFFKSPSG